ncbi:MFS transporter [Burkholderia cenocepacia]|uniref:MFS transporter n=1 Tax=Burkholderia cenocepacia TaxID=95486 RepID=UPI002AB21434|nr:MFS transporter [Burkholderia cenocepacia]
MQSSSFRSVLVGDIFASFGSWIDFLAILNLSAYQFNATPYDMAELSGAFLLPGIVLARRVGKTCDKNDARKVLYAAVFLRIAGTIAILYSTHYTEFLLFVAAHSAAGAFIIPSINTLTARITPPDLLARRFSLLNVTNNSCKVLAPTLGAAASQFFGEHSVLWVSVLLTAMGGICFMFAPKALASTKVPDTVGESESSTRIAGTSMLPLLAIVAIYTCLGMAVNNQMPLILKDLGFEKHVIGLLVSSAGAGGAIGAIYLLKRGGKGEQKNMLTDIIRPPMFSSLLFVIIGCVLLWTPAWGAIALCACFFASGVSGAAFSVSSNVYIGRTFSSNLGEVSSIRQGVQSAAQLLAPLIGAFFLARFAPSKVFLMDGVFVLVLLVITRFIVRKHTDSAHLSPTTDGLREMS